ncbi:MAG: M6 family metalloprotease domain-containing protein [Gemmatimonadota bacterium]|nr:MAG: M6 family metalloprotease domain-containing protein [Gemmatimonadota bacterium]
MRRAKGIVWCLLFLVFVSTNSLLAVSAKPGLLSKNESSRKIGAFLRHSQAGVDEPEPLRAPVTGSRKAIVLLVEFTDNRANRGQHPPSAYETLLFDSTGAVPTGSMYDYYQEVSYGQFFISGVVTNWILLPQTNEYYAGDGFGRGEWPQNRRRLAYDAVVAADPFVDFSQFDEDGDGFVDALFIVHAGPGGEETGDSLDIWSHKWRIPENEDGTGDGYVTDDGVRAYSYAMEPEEDEEGSLITIGVFCHEYGHVLGLPDLYDRDDSSEGVGNWAMMGSGSWGGDGQSPELPVHFCAWSKERLGWVTPIVVTDNLPAQPIAQVEEFPEVYKLWTEGAPGDEYFLVENRQNVGFDVNLYNTGLLIWHVDNTVTTQNDDEDHKLVDLESADGCNDMDRGNGRGDDGDSYPGSSGNRMFSLFTNPNSRINSGDLSQVAVMNISDSQSIMIADLEVFTKNPLFIYDDTQVVDADGNDNGKPDPGETVDVVISVLNYGADATSVSGKLSTLDQSIHFLVDETSFSNIPFDSSGDNSAAPFSFSVDEAADVHYAYFTLDIWSDVGGEITQLSLRVTIGQPDILLVDDDYDTTANESKHEVEGYYRAALDSLEQIFDHWDYESAGPCDSDWLETYEIVIWSTGFTQQTLSMEDQTHLAAFLDGGGKLFISGQNVATEIQSSSFLNEYLHAEWMADNSDEGIIYGIGGDPISGNINFVTIAGDECADIQLSPDAIAPMPEASALFTYEPSGRAAGIKYSGEHRLVFLPFGFESIIDPVHDSEETRAHIMENIIDWLRIVPVRGDATEDGSVDILDVIRVVNIILGLVEPVPSHIWGADCTGNGSIDIVDGIGIVNVVLGMGVCQPGAQRAALTPEVLEYLESLKPHFSDEHFAKFMALLKEDSTAPVAFGLAQNYPNPFNPTTTIEYSVVSDQSPSHVTLNVYNLLGQRVRTLVDGVKEPGYHTVTWDGMDEEGDDVSSGVYFYRLQAGEFTAKKKMMFLK